LGPRLQFIGSNGHKSKRILQHLADIPTNCVVKDSDGPNFEDNQCRCGLPFISITVFTTTPTVTDDVNYDKCQSPIVCNKTSITSHITVTRSSLPMQ